MGQQTRILCPQLGTGLDSPPRCHSKAPQAPSRPFKTLAPPAGKVLASGKGQQACLLSCTLSTDSSTPRRPATILEAHPGACCRQGAGVGQGAADLDPQPSARHRPKHHPRNIDGP